MARVGASGTNVPEADLMALAHTATGFALEVKKRDASFSFRLPAKAAPGELADLCAHHLVIDPEARQRALETLDVAERIRIVTSELASQNAALGARTNGALN